MSKRRGGPVNTPTARRLFPETRWEPLSPPSASNLNFCERLFPFLPRWREIQFLKFKKYSWQTEKSCDNPSSASLSNLNSHERLFPFPPPPSFTSHFLFLPDPWYLLRCRWMVGNSDGSVIETYSPDPAAGGDNNKISISANFHQSDRCLCRPNGPLGVRISDMKYSSRPQI